MIEKERERKSVEPGKEYVEARSWGLASSMSCRLNVLFGDIGGIRMGAGSSN
jgi:hypothetical protein